jgi:hypothetical protein
MNKTDRRLDRQFRKYDKLFDEAEKIRIERDNLREISYHLAFELEMLNPNSKAFEAYQEFTK